MPANTELLAAKPRVLVVEDEGIIARDIQKMLQRLGYEVSGPAGTGAEALAETAAHPADVVLMDIKIRGPVDGVETAEEISRRYRIPVVFLTAHADNGTLSRVTQTAPYGYVVKPFTEAGIKVAIEVALTRRKLEREKQARQDWLYAALESVADAVFITNRTGNVDFLNGTAEELTGWTSEQARGLSFAEVVKLDIASDFIDSLPIEFHDAFLCTRHGEKIPVVGSSAPFRVSDAEPAGGTVILLRPARFNQASSYASTEGNTASRGKLQELSHALTHDLREPVRNMACFAQLLSRQSSAAGLDEAARDYLQMIVDGSKHMDSLLAGLHKYHSAGDKVVDPDACADATAAWADAAASLSEAVRRSCARICINELPQVAMDAASLKEIFEALLSNALRFRSGEFPHVEASARREDRFWHFIVSDNGLGLEVGQSERVFGLFKKAHRPGLSGAGIGLAVCRQLVELYGGRIWLQSRPGQGMQAHFTVPALASE